MLYCFHHLKIVIKIVIMVNFNGDVRDLYTDNFVIEMSSEIQKNIYIFSYV